MTLQIGDIAPNFEAQSTRGEIRFYEWLADDWAMVLTYTEPLNPAGAEAVRAVEANRTNFKQLGCKVIGLVAESAGNFDDWVNALSDGLGVTPTFPIVAEGALGLPAIENIGQLGGVAGHTLLVIGSDKRVKLAITNPIIDDTRFGEILRLIESLQYAGARRMTKPSADGLIVLPCAPSLGQEPGQAKEQPPRKRCG